MADRALFAAFQKVRADVDQALEETRRKEAQKRAEEEALRLKKRKESERSIAKLKQAIGVEIKTKSEIDPEKIVDDASEINLTFGSSKGYAPKIAPKGAFGTALAAASSGARFRDAATEAVRKEETQKKTPPQKPLESFRVPVRANATSRSSASLTSSAQARSASFEELQRLASGKLAGLDRQRSVASAGTERRADAKKSVKTEGQIKKRAVLTVGRQENQKARSFSGDARERSARREDPSLAHSDRLQERQPRRQGEKPAERRIHWKERRMPVPPFELMPGLPVSERADEIIKAIRENQVVVVCGETGSGKTTQLPKIALMAGRGETGRIGCTQPRRLAASSIAKRVAEELKTPLGDIVGFKVRFTDSTSPGASLKFMTDGILLAETQTDPMLRAYDTIIIDEAHERSINIDFLLGYLKRLLPRRPDLKVIVTSATIDTERFAAHFAKDGKPAPVLTISGRTYPVEIRYRPMEDADEEDDRTMLGAIENAVSELETAGSGDILVFCPGEREIRETADYLRKNRVGKAEILPLYARLSASEQDRVFKPGGMRRIVLATNVAETSITVPGIRYVIDPGYARVKRYSYRSKVEQLLVEPISQASANQRAGRCGRVAEGICIRLYSEDDFNRRPAFTDPEITRSNLAAVILRAMSLRLGDIRAFPFVQVPPPKAIADGFAILQELGAVVEEKRPSRAAQGETETVSELTAVGRELAKLPVDPKLGRMLLAGSQFGSLRELLIITSGLSVQDPRERPIDARQAADEAHKKLSDERSDFLSYVKLWDWVEKARSEKESNRKFDAELKSRFLSPRRLREWREVEKQLETLALELGWRMNTASATFEEVHRALLAGLLGNIGSKAVESDFRQPPYLGARGIKFWIWPGSMRVKKSGRWIFAAQIIETSKLYARCVADIEPEWIEAAAGDLMRRSWSEPHWEKKRGEVVAMERGTLYGLTIYQQRRVSFAKHDPTLSRELFIREALVPGEIEGEFPFLKHNRRQIEEIRELEHKTRRPDVLVDEELIFKFYDEALPKDVNSKATLEKWLKSAEKENPKILRLTKDELMRHEAAGVTTAYFPKTLTMAGVEMTLSYHFEPGSPRDGVTVTVPLFALNQLDAIRAEWLVPGMVKEKTQVLLKSLPQKIRRHCVPISDYALGFFTRTGNGGAQKVPFLQALASDIRENLGIPCTPSDFKPEQLAPHLILNFKVVDEHGRQLGMGRNLAELRTELGTQAQETFRSVAQQDAQVALDLAGAEAVTNWTFGELPELMEIQRRGETLIGHPALVDRGECCSIEVFDNPLEAEKAHRRGLLRLFRLTLREQVKFVERSLRDLGRIQMQASIVPGLADTFESIDSLEADVVDCALTATALTEPLPNNEQTFQERREDVRGRLTLVAGEISRLLTDIVTNASPIPLKLKRMAGEKALLEDVENQLRQLFPPHFLTKVPLNQLSHYPRYLKAIVYRLERYADDPARDASKLAEISRLTTEWLRAVAARKGQADQHLEEFGWLLEELRVSLFAQQLRTPMPVSVKRLERVWHSIQRL